MKGDPLPQAQPFSDAEIGEFLARSAELSRYDPDPESIECRARLAATLAELAGLRDQVKEARRIAKRLEAGGYQGVWVGRKPAPPLHTVYRYDVTALTELLASGSLPGALKEEKDND